MTIAATLPAQIIDVRLIAPPQRHALIFSTFEGLAVGQSLELQNDHDPMPLHRQFRERFPEQFNWEYLEQGPAQWRVNIARLKEAGASCCGCCGGA